MKGAFTFIEIIVVVTIIALISTGGFFYFASFLWQKDIITQVEQIEAFLDEKHSDIQRVNISNFTMDFSLWKGAIYDINNDGVSYSYFQNVDFDTGDFGVVNYGSGVYSWNVKVFADNKLSDNILFSPAWVIPFTFTGSSSYILHAYEDWLLTNTLWAMYYSDENLENNPDKFLLLGEINMRSDKSWTSFSEVSLHETPAGKVILGSGSILESVYLFFTRGEYEYSLKLER